MTTELGPGGRLGPYEITAKLGEGGMGPVLRCIGPEQARRHYDAGPDGRFVVVSQRFVSTAPRELVLLQGWTAADPARAGAR